MKHLAFLIIPTMITGILISGCEKDPSVPEISTSEATEITDKTALCGGEIVDDGGADIIDRGIIWGISSNINIDNNDGIISEGKGKGLFTVILTGLQPGTTYYVKAFASNKAGVAYGHHKKLTTLEALPEIETLSVTHISPQHMSAGGRINNYHGHEIIEAGVCWGLNPNPTKDLNAFAVADLYYEEFYCFVSDLTPATQYYLRAYVTTSHGNSYGNEVNFITSAAFNVIGIEDLKDAYTGLLQITSDVVIEAVVTANDESGNLYKKLILQDGTGAIELGLDETNLYVKYPVGQQVYVKCKDLYLGDYNNLIQLGYPFDNFIGRIPWQLIPYHLFRYPPPLISIEPQTIRTFANLNNNLVSKLVRFENVSFAEPGVRFADPPYNSTNRVLLDANGNEIEVRTSKYAKFANELTPHGIGDITGILSVFGTTYQLWLRNVNDLGDFVVKK